MYYQQNNSGQSVIVDTVNMTWKHLSDNTYQFAQNGVPFTKKVMFENENKKLILETSHSDDNVIINVHKFIYIRIN